VRLGLSISPNPRSGSGCALDNFGNKPLLTPASRADTGERRPVRPLDNAQIAKGSEVDVDTYVLPEPAEIEPQA